MSWSLTVFFSSDAASAVAFYSSIPLTKLIQEFPPWRLGRHIWHIRHGVAQIKTTCVYLPDILFTIICVSLPKHPPQRISFFVSFFKPKQKIDKLIYLLINKYAFNTFLSFDKFLAREIIIWYHPMILKKLQWVVLEFLRKFIIYTNWKKSWRISMKIFLERLWNFFGIVALNLFAFVSY